jgi:hypothetical protein
VDYNEIFQGGNRRDEQIWLSKGVAMLSAFDYHRFPADNQRPRLWRGRGLQTTAEAFG